MEAQSAAIEGRALSPTLKKDTKIIILLCEKIQ